MATRRVAGARRRPSGLLVLVLGGFLLVATGIVWRRSEGLSRAREFQVLERRRDALVAQQRQLEADVREAGSRRRLAPIVEQRLGMRVPTADQLVYLNRPTRATAAPHDSQ